MGSIRSCPWAAECVPPAPLQINSIVLINVVVAVLLEKMMAVAGGEEGMQEFEQLYDPHEPLLPPWFEALASTREETTPAKGQARHRYPCSVAHME